MSVWLEFIRDGYKITARHDEDSSHLFDELPDMWPGMTVTDYSWNQNKWGDLDVLEELDILEEDIARMQDTWEEARENLDQCFSKFFSVAYNRIVEPDELDKAQRRVSDAVSDVENIMSDLGSLIDDHNGYARFRFNPYVDTHGYSVIVDCEKFSRVTGCGHEQIESNAISFARYVDTLQGGGVFGVEVCSVEPDPDTPGEWVETGEVEESVWGVVFSDNIPDENEIYAYAKETFNV